MNTAILDINDCNVQLWNGDKRVQSPGYVLLANDTYSFGNNARQVARVQPRDVNTRYWWQLNTAPLQPALGPARHAADLVHSHLQELHRDAGEPEHVILATPGSMQREQLALLLGIVNTCNFAAVGLINRSIAACSYHPLPAGTFWHLELHLHQATLSQLSCADNMLSFHHSTAFPGSGLLQLQESIADKLRSAFVAQTRFDPRRKAASEQALFDAIPGALQNLCDSGEANLRVEGYQARVLHEDLVAVGHGLMKNVAKVIANSADRIFIDPILALLPGFVEGVGNATVLGTQDVRSGLAEQIENIRQEGRDLHYITTIAAPMETTGHTEVGRAAAAPKLHATHILQGHRATPLTGNDIPLVDGWHLVSDDNSWSLTPGQGTCRINGEEYSSASALNAGDTIEIGSATPLTLIQVER